MLLEGAFHLNLTITEGAWQGGFGKGLELPASGGMGTVTRGCICEGENRTYVWKGKGGRL